MDMDYWIRSSVLPCILILVLCNGMTHVTSLKTHELYNVDNTLRWHAYEEDGNCTDSMFPEDAFARWACQTQVAFQTNWFPSPISGLFSYQVWNGFDGFWQNGCVLETFANFMAYGGHQRYKTILRKSLRTVQELIEAYYPHPSYDDMSWFGLSYLRVYEVLGDEDFLQEAKNIYEWTWGLALALAGELDYRPIGQWIHSYCCTIDRPSTDGWDNSSSCGGGMWFDQGHYVKVTITNVQMLHLGAKLYKATGSKNKTLLATVHKIWNFINNTKIINKDTFLVADAVNLTSCVRNEDYSHTYTSGVLAGGLVHVAQAFNDSGFLDLAHKIANATMFYRTKNGIFYEPCDLDHSCNKDAFVFKGIFVRYLRYVMDASDNQTASMYRTWLEANGNAMIEHDRCLTDVSECGLVFTDGMPYYPPTTPVFDSPWGGPYNFSAPMQQASALDLLVSLIKPGTRCEGAGCMYDPPIPPIRPLTCKDSPCPPGHACCEYGGGYRTCCTPDQTCNYGSCV